MFLSRAMLDTILMCRDKESTFVYLLDELMEALWYDGGQ